MKTKKIIFVIAQNIFRDEELVDTKKVLDDAGFTTKIASKTTNMAKGKLGLELKPDMTLRDINPEEVDALVFVGGSGSRDYYNDAEALTIAKQTYNAGKVVAAICAAPSILVRAGLLQGVHATSHDSQKEDLKEHGTIYIDSPVVEEDRIITAKNPAAAKAFGEAIKKRLTA